MPFQIHNVTVCRIQIVLHAEDKLMIVSSFAVVALGSV